LTFGAPDTKTRAMRAGRPSVTAELVCMGRAVADAAPPFPGFADATALRLLSERARARVARATGPKEPLGLRERIDRGYLTRQSQLMAIRTRAIDEVVRTAAAPQVVILGAGLDGRAWRMPELAQAVVFEVDHPDSQRQKRARAGALSLAARQVRFLAVDFARDSLDGALAQAGHDPGQRTLWLWEGVVMYLDRTDIESTLRVIEGRSARGSLLSVLYAAPTWLLSVVGLVVRSLGEPFRTALTPEEARTLLDRFGFTVTSDANLPTLGSRHSAALGRASRVARHLRILTAVRR
jgi:methyltransferase (TIGR00027 family)